MATTLQLDDDLTIQESPWRGRLIALGVLLALTTAAAIAAYVFWFNDDSAEGGRATEDITVGRATINANLIISGTADAQLNSDLSFQSSGRVESVGVRIGDRVTSGQVLASLESDDLTNAVSTAQANMRTAQLRLNDLLDGSTAAELAAAEQVVAQSQAALTKAKNDYDDLLDAATGTDVAAAEQGVRLAESQVATAESALAKLDDAPTSADLAAAKAGVASAKSALTAAQNSVASATNSKASAAASLKSAETAYCAIPPVPVPAFCAAAATPISAGDATLLDAALSGTNASLASAVITSNTLYLNAVNALASASAAVDAAEDSLDSAEAKLDAAEEGPTSKEVEAAEANLFSAQAALLTAEKKLADVTDGATPAELANSLATLRSAEASLASAQAKRDETVRGAEANEIELSRQAVRTSQLAVEAAQIRLKNATIAAPFDGTVAAVNITPGEFQGLASTTPAIVLLTPDVLQLDISLGETDYPNVKKDQGGIGIFDGIPGRPFPFRISEIGLSPTVTQGVVTYKVKASLAVSGDGPRPAPGMNFRGQLTTESRPNVVAVPPRAIRRKGSDQVVDVRRNGGVEEQVITTGLSNNDNVEVLTGLNEGDVLVVVALVQPGSGRVEPQPTLPGGVR